MPCVSFRKLNRALNLKTVQNRGITYPAKGKVLLAPPLPDIVSVFQAYQGAGVSRASMAARVVA